MKKSIFKAVLVLTMLASLTACSKPPATFCHDCDDKNPPDEPGAVVTTTPAPNSTVPTPAPAAKTSAPAAKTPASKDKLVVTAP